jgi:purine-binding chemotaxis protein CheW
MLKRKVEKVEEQSAQYVTFRLDEEIFAIDIMNARKVIKVNSVTHIPELPDFILGVYSLGKRVIPIIDLKLKFGLTAHQEQFFEKKEVIIIRLETISCGIVIDKVLNVETFKTAIIEAVPSVVNTEARVHLKGIVKLEGKIISIVEAERIFSTEEKEILKDESK